MFTSAPTATFSLSAAPRRRRCSSVVACGFDCKRSRATRQKAMTMSVPCKSVDILALSNHRRLDVTPDRNAALGPLEHVHFAQILGATRIQKILNLGHCSENSQRQLSDLIASRKTGRSEQLPDCREVRTPVAVAAMGM